MLYLLAVFVPPLALLFTSYWLAGLLLAVPWAAVSVLTGGVGHVGFVVITWIMLASAKSERRHRELLRAVMRDKT